MFVYTKAMSMKRLSGCLILLAGVLICLVPLPVGASAQVSSFLYANFEPFALYCDGKSEATMEVATRGRDLELVTAEVHRSPVDFEKVLVDGKKTSRMYDDGTHGDRKANDGVYTVRFGQNDYNAAPYSTTSAGLYFIKKGARKSADSGYYAQDPLVEHIDSGSYGTVNTANHFPLTKLAENLFATPYAVFLVDKDRKIFPNFPLDNFVCFETKFIKAATKALYSAFPDSFDYVTVMPGGTIYTPAVVNSWGYGENVPYFVSVKQDVRNIGLPRIDHTRDYGSKGRLQGVIYHSFGTGEILDHEIGHNWGISYGSKFGLVPKDDVHWSANTDLWDQMTLYFFSNGSAVHFRRKDDTDFTAITNLSEKDENNPGYDDLTLYLMGLIPPEQVRPVHILIDPVFAAPDQVSYKQVKTVTIDQLLKAEGRREPAYPNTQREFNMAFVIITTHEPTDAEAAFYSLIAKYLGSGEKARKYLIPFQTATRGKAILNTKLPGIAGE